MDIYHEFLAVVDALNSAMIEYAVCGGMALAIHGHPRMTHDVDFLFAAESLRPAWEGREAFSWEGRTVTVVSREGLAGMKELAGRPQDLADLSALEEITRDE